MERTSRGVVIACAQARLAADLVLPRGPVRGLVVCAGAGAVSRSSPTTRSLVEQLARRAEVATLLFDLVAPAEANDLVDSANQRAQVPALAQRLSAATDWALLAPETRHLPIGYFTSGVGAAAALLAATSRPEVHAIVSRDGRPDLAGAALEAVRAPTLLLVTNDDALLASNRSARARLRAKSDLALVQGPAVLGNGDKRTTAEEPAALEDVARRVSAWFAQHIT